VNEAEALSAIFRPSPAWETRGALIASEGLDGSGKSTLMSRLRRVLGRRRSATLTGWNETTEIYNLMMQLNAAGLLTNETRCVFGAAELAARYHYVVRPALHRGDVVLANKHVVSAQAHALVRGHSLEFLETLYAFALEPDVTLYVEVSPETALERKLQAGRIGFWEAGLDLTLGLPLDEALRRYGRGSIPLDTLATSFVDFQGRLAGAHRRLLARATNAVVLDGTLAPDELVDAALPVVTDVLARTSAEAEASVTPTEVEKGGEECPDTTSVAG
jgi:dTMP kinase